MCHSQPDQSHLYQPLPTWGGKGPLRKRKRRAESTQKSVSFPLKVWADNKSYYSLSMAANRRQEHRVKNGLGTPIE